MADIKAIIGADTGDFNRKMKGVSERMERVGKRMENIGKSMLKVTAIATGLATVAVIAFDKQVQAENKLIAALKATGQESEATFNDLKKFASGIQEITTVGDEATLQMLQVASSMGLSTEQAKRASKNAIALAKAMGMNEQSAIRYTAALEQGDATMLTRYLPTLRQLDDQSERAAMAQKLLADMFSSATAEAEDGLGPFKQMTNTMGDMMEEFGALITQAIKPFISWLKSMAEKLKGLDESTKKTILIIGGIAAAIGPVLIALGAIVKLAPIVAAAWALMTGPIGLIIIALAALATAGFVFRDEIGAAIEGAKAVWEQQLILMQVAIKQAINEIKSAWNTMIGFFGAEVDLTPAFVFSKKEIDAITTFAGEGAAPTFLEAFKKGMEGKGGVQKVLNDIFGDATLPTPTISTDDLTDAMEDAQKEAQKIEADPQAFFDIKLTEEALIKRQKLFDEAEQRQLEQQERIRRANLTAAERTAEDWTTNIKKIQEKFNMIADVVQQAWGVVSDAIGIGIENKMTLLEESHAREVEMIENSRMTEEGKQAALSKLDKRTAKERKKLQRKQAIANKAGAMLSATVNTAAAIIAALAFVPPNVPLSIAVGAIGAAQLAVIAATPIPLAEGGIVTSPTMGLIGEAGPEAVIPLSKMDMFAGELRTKITAEDIELILTRREKSKSFLS